jgi:hypothetical protein
VNVHHCLESGFSDFESCVQLFWRVTVALEHKKEKTKLMVDCHSLSFRTVHNNPTTSSKLSTPCHYLVSLVLATFRIQPHNFLRPDPAQNAPSSNAPAPASANAAFFAFYTTPHTNSDSTPIPFSFPRTNSASPLSASQSTAASAIPNTNAPRVSHKLCCFH